MKWTSCDGEVELWKVPSFPLEWCLWELFRRFAGRGMVMAVPRTIGRRRGVKLCVWLWFVAGGGWQLGRDRGGRRLEKGCGRQSSTFGFCKRPKEIVHGMQEVVGGITVRDIRREERLWEAKLVDPTRRVLDLQSFKRMDDGIG